MKEFFDVTVSILVEAEDYSDAVKNVEICFPVLSVHSIRKLPDGEKEND